MHIGMILDKPFPPDPRVANEASTLTEAGHRVSLLCLTWSRRLREREKVQGVSVVRVFVPRTLYQAASLLIFKSGFFQRFWEHQIIRFVREERIEILHLHDLQLAGPGVAVAEHLGVPAVVDLHEDRAAIILEYHLPLASVTRKLVAPELWHRYENHWLPRSSAVITVTHEAKQALQERLTPRRLPRATVVPNTIRLAELESASIEPEVLRRYSSGFVVGYVGDTSLRRGTDTLIRAVARLSTRSRTWLLMVGSSKDDPQLRSMVRDLNLKDRVHFAGWQPHDRLFTFIATMSVGTCPFRRNPHHDTTLANKLFQYMGLGKPVIVSDCPAQARIVAEEECGVVFRAGDDAALAHAILDLMENPHKRNALGRNASKAVREKYNWEKTSTALVELYKELEDLSGGRER